MKTFLAITLFVLCLDFSGSRAQAPLYVYGNPVWTNKIDSALKLIYNLEFDKAEVRIREIESHYGQHPAVLLLKAEMVFWKNRPLQKNTDPYNEYMGLLNKVVEQSQTLFPDKDDDMEKNFYLMSGYCLLTEQYAEDNDLWSVLTNAKYAYKYLKNGMGNETKIPDYYFTTGLYNYYRVEYPELHPFYKPFLWLFMDGDKKLGIEDLKKASQSALFLKEQANIYLFHIYLRYENNPAKALPYAKFLDEAYPNNLRFKCLYAEALYYSRDFTPLDSLARLLAGQSKKFYSIPGYLFKGLVAEHNNNLPEAKKYFNFSLSQASGNEGEDDHYLAMNYAGLARVAIRENNIDDAKKYYTLAAKTEPYIPVKEEANAFLSKYDQ